MKPCLYTILLIMLGGWINRHQQDAIEYLMAENKILRGKLGNKRILLNDGQKQFLAVLAKRIGRKVLSKLCCAFSPDILLGWHRELIARKYDGRRRTLMCTVYLCHESDTSCL
jgi:hypothetical protein